MGGYQAPKWKETWMECICPECCGHHMVKMHWIGRGLPRKYCDNCRQNLQRENPESSLEGYAQYNMQAATGRAIRSAF